MPLDEGSRRSIERWFVGRGVPHFIVNYNARDDVFTRAAPLLAVVFLAEIGAAFDFNFSWWQNALAFLGGVGILAGGIVVANQIRGRRRFQLPDRIGLVELACFVVVPPLIPAVISSQWQQAFGLLASNIGVLFVVYVGTSYGILPMLRWATIHTGKQIGDVLNLLAKSLPLMLLFSMFIFINAEMWKIADEIPAAFLAIAVGLLMLAGSAFLVLRTPKELSQLSRFESWDDVHAGVEGTPGSELNGSTEEHPADPLERRERINLGLLLFFAQSVQVLLVTLVIAAFYLVFGLVIMQHDTIVQWVGEEPRKLGPTLDLLGNDMFLSRPLLVAAIFVAAVAGLQFAIQVATDPTYRDEFRNDIMHDLRSVLAVRLLYRKVLTERHASDAERPRRQQS